MKTTIAITALITNYITQFQTMAKDIDLSIDDPVLCFGAVKVNRSYKVKILYWRIDLWKLDNLTKGQKALILRRSPLCKGWIVTCPPTSHSVAIQINWECACSGDEYVQNVTLYRYQDVSNVLTGKQVTDPDGIWCLGSVGDLLPVMG